MLITLEGVPAVGKSTVAKLLENEHGYVRVPEVNELFPERPKTEPKNWYALKQIERSNIANSHQKSILDGDIFQVVWLSWIFPERGFVNYAETLDLFMRNVDSIYLPSLFVYLYVADEIRYEREKNREFERGHNYQQFLNKYKRYESMCLPQKALFDAINKDYPGWVFFVENVNSKSTAQDIAQKRVESVAPSASEFIAWLTKWLAQNASNKYSGIVG